MRKSKMLGSARQGFKSKRLFHRISEVENQEKLNQLILEKIEEVANTSKLQVQDQLEIVANDLKQSNEASYQIIDQKIKSAKEVICQHINEKIEKSDSCLRRVANEHVYYGVTVVKEGKLWRCPLNHPDLNEQCKYKSDRANNIKNHLGGLHGLKPDSD